jgi:metal-sulfur cluster biosynthetic enzyme
MAEIDITDPHTFLKEEVKELLYQVYDPEVGLDIINMGLVYGIDYNEEKNMIIIVMTLTSRGCPMGPMITENAAETLQQHFPDKDVHIHLVWDPKWTAEKISEEGRKALGWT